MSFFWKNLILPHLDLLFQNDLQFLKWKIKIETFEEFDSTLQRDVQNYSYTTINILCLSKVGLNI